MTNVLTDGERAYYSRSLQNRFHSKLAHAYVEKADREGLTKATIAKYIGKDQATVSRILTHPTNMTIETMALLMAALSIDLDFDFAREDDLPLHNHQHEWFNVSSDKEDRNISAAGSLFPALTVGDVKWSCAA